MRRKNMVKSKDDSKSIKKCKIERSAAGGGRTLRKGPWTSVEDEILKNYVNKHGEGNWNVVQKHSGLFRCGKSCRLRWSNHLKPDLKKYPIKGDEERLIIQLHHILGNKWALMAERLPGRTDNEIKNFWNTRSKRCKKTGLPLYPPEIISKAADENVPSLDASQLNSTDHLLMGKADLGVDQGFATEDFGIVNPGVNETLLPVFHDSGPTGFPTLGQFPTGPAEGFHEPSSRNLAPFRSASLGSHAVSNGNNSTPMPLAVARMLELPSVQYNVPPVEAASAYIQSPPETASPLQFDDLDSSLNIPLLNEMIHGICSCPACTASDMVGNSALNYFEADRGVHDDPVPPSGLGAAPVFTETPHISGASFDGFPPRNPPPGCDPLMTTTGHVTAPVSGEIDVPTLPNNLKGFDWFHKDTQKEVANFILDLSSYLFKMRGAPEKDASHLSDPRS